MSTRQAKTPVKSNTSGKSTTPVKSTTSEKRTLPPVVPSPKRRRLEKPTVTELSAYDDFKDPKLSFQPKVFALYDVPTVRSVKVNGVPTSVTNFVALDAHGKSLEISIWDKVADDFSAAIAKANFPVKAVFRGTYIKKERNRYSLNVDSEWPVGVRKDGAVEIVEEGLPESAPAPETTIIAVKLAIDKAKKSNIVHKNLRLEVFSEKAVFGGETVCDVSDGNHRARLVASAVSFDLANGATIRLNSFKAQFEMVNDVPMFTLKPLSPMTQLFPTGDNDPLAVEYYDDDLEAIPFITPEAFPSLYKVDFLSLCGVNVRPMEVGIIRCRIAR